MLKLFFVASMLVLICDAMTKKPDVFNLDDTTYYNDFIEWMEKRDEAAFEKWCPEMKSATVEVSYN